MADPIEKGFNDNNESPLQVVREVQKPIEQTNVFQMNIDRDSKSSLRVVSDTEVSKEQGKLVEMKQETKAEINQQIKSLEEQLKKHNEAIGRMEVAHAYDIEPSSLKDEVHKYANLNPGEIKKDLQYYKRLKKRRSIFSKISSLFRS